MGESCRAGVNLPYSDRVLDESIWGHIPRLIGNRPAALVVTSFADPSTLERLVRDYPDAHIYIRPRTGPQGEPFPTDILDYRSWPTERSLRDCLTTLSELGAIGRTTWVGGNEPNLEWGRDAALAYAAWWTAEAPKVTEAFPGIGLAVAPMAQGDPDTEWHWFRTLKDAGCYDLATELADHCYFADRPYDDPDWGGRGKPLLDFLPRFSRVANLETDDDGRFFPQDPSERAEAYAGYVKWAAESGIYSCVCLFTLEGAPDDEHKPAWWFLTDEIIDATAAVAAALEPPAAPPEPVAPGEPTPPPAPVPPPEVPVPSLVRSCDVSNYQSDTLAEVPADVEHIVVRLSTETRDKSLHAIRQLRAAKARGLSCSGYVWCYWQADPIESVKAALAVAGETGVPLRAVWLDAEDERGAEPSRVVAWLQAALDEIKRAGQRGGIYTGAWFWQGYVGNSETLTGTPAWLADYDGAPALDVEPLGGFRIVGKQYVGSPVDLDVFDRAWLNTPLSTEAPMTYNPEFPVQYQIRQDTCAVRSLDMLLSSIGINIAAGDLQDAMERAGAWKPGVGNTDATGGKLEAFIRDRWPDLDAHHLSPITFDQVAAIAGKAPLMLGGAMWDHWVAVRGVRNDRLILANPGGHPPASDPEGLTTQYMQQSLDRGLFARLGPMSAVWVEMPQPEQGDDPVRVRDLEQERDRLVNALAYALDDVIGRDVAGLTVYQRDKARRDRILTEAHRLRVEQLGEKR